MERIIQNLKTLCAITGVAGYEKSAAEKACELLREYIPGAECDLFGNVSGVLPSRKENAPTLLLDAHIDEIGMIVTSIDEKGFVRFAKCGGMDRRILSAQYVTVHGSRPVPGIIGSVPPHLQKKEDANKVPDFDAMFVDVGMTREEAEAVISLGDRITVNSTFSLLLNDQVTSKALDDRAGVAAILETLELLKNDAPNVNLAVQFSGREETGGQGCIISSFQMEPDMAIALDVSFAATPDMEKSRYGELGKGVLIGIAPSLNKEMTDALLSVAKEKSIPWQPEVMGGGTGTNADSIAVSRSGVRTGLLSIPQKYMHTPIEVVDVKDIRSAAELMAEYIRTL